MDETDMTARSHRIAPPPLGRRHVLVGGLCLCCLPSLVRAETAPGPLATEEVAPGIHIRRGVDQDANTDNQDAIANIGFVIGREAVLVADPGGSLADGERLRAAIREKTALPIRYVVMSHVHPDHIFGAGAFRQDDPVFVGHARLADALAQRGSYYQRRLEEILGPGRAGPVVMPTMTVADKAEIDLGGRAVALTAHGVAHTDNDLSLLDRLTGTLLPADLLFVKRIPSLDGSLKGWLQELAALKATRAARAVPGHGPTSVEWPGAAADQERYLGTLLRETRQAVARNVGIEAAVTTVAASERGKWALFDDYNGRNVTMAYKELEWE
ncbi:MAG: quinoprotein relay system zinc metallohydrolase 2 [Pseudomonadota bacterium]